MPAVVGDTLCRTWLNKVSSEHCQALLEADNKDAELGKVRGAIQIETGSCNYKTAVTCQSLLFMFRETALHLAHRR